VSELRKVTIWLDGDQHGGRRSESIVEEVMDMLYNLPMHRRFLDPVKVKCGNAETVDLRGWFSNE